MVKDKCMYKSYKIKLLRSDNSHAILKNGKYIRIIKFVVDVRNYSAAVIFKEVIVSNIFGDNLFNPQLKKVSSVSDETYFIDVGGIDKISVLSKILDSYYISSVPNLYNF